MRMGTSRPNSEVILRIMGFTEAQSKSGKNQNRVQQDPVIVCRTFAAYRKRPGWPDDLNVFCSYKKAPRRPQEAHLNFPENFNIQDEACTLAIWNKMTEQERQELRERVLGDTPIRQLTLADKDLIGVEPLF
jgi:hypothetical protein